MKSPLLPPSFVRATGIVALEHQSPLPVHQLAKTKPAHRRRPDCIHLGLPVLHQPKCGCGEKLRVCDEFGVCRVSVAKDGVACCGGCEKYENPLT